MKHNGMYALDFQGPALVEGRLTYLRGARYLDTVVALCFLPYARPLLADTIDRQARRFQGIGAALVLVASSRRPLHHLWAGQQDRPITPILADLCGLVRRSFGVAVDQETPRCHTFVIDRMGILRLRVSHDFI